MVMCSEPVTRTPESGFSTAYFRRMAIRPGISYSAMEISLRPQSARERSATLKSVWFSVAVLIENIFLISRNLDTLILEDSADGVNPKIFASGGRSQPPPPAPPAGAGRTVGSGVARHSGAG